MNKRTLSLVILVLSFLISAYLGTDQIVRDKKAVEGLKDILTITPSPTSIPTPSLQFGEKVSAQVIKVVDGDTITVMIDNKKETIRIIGIDTPETVDPRKPVQCFGLAASRRAKIMLLNQNVLLESDPSQDNRDKYNRLLRFVWLNNGLTDYGLTTIAEGYAYEYTYQIPYKYQAEYKKAQTTAQTNKVGLWAPNACVTPTLPEEENP